MHGGQIQENVALREILKMQICHSGRAQKKVRYRFVERFAMAALPALSRQDLRPPPPDLSFWSSLPFLPDCVVNIRKDGACGLYVMVSNFQWKPFWLATQQDPQNDWTATQNHVNYDVFAQAHFQKKPQNKCKKKLVKCATKDAWLCWVSRQSSTQNWRSLKVQNRLTRLNLTF